MRIQCNKTHSHWPLRPILRTKVILKDAKSIGDFYLYFFLQKKNLVKIMVQSLVNLRLNDFVPLLYYIGTYIIGADLFRDGMHSKNLFTVK